jgi:N-acetylglucosaminyldiphosphoundecaprenol N-acetyl-beta-D-mannosaminyltransferase
MRVSVAGCPVDTINRGELIETLCQAIIGRQLCLVSGPNAAFAVMAAKDPCYRELLEKFTFLPADGYWISFAAKLLGYKGVAHVGVERLIYDLLPRIAELKGTVYLLGARDFIVKKAAEKIEASYKGIKIAGVRDGYFSEQEEAEILYKINQVKPDLLMVGITSPKKEIWMNKYRDYLRATVVIGVGGLFDVIAGHIPPSPFWMKDCGLEWFFRFINDPRRLWKRYLIGNAQFLWLLLMDFIKKQGASKN